MHAVARSRHPLFGVLLSLGLCAGIATAPVNAQESYKLGVSGTATGPASPSYAPHVEGLRLYLRQLNDKGGVDGHKVEAIVLDDKGAPSDAASNAKRLMDDEQVLAVALMSLSSTYAPMFQRATRTETPVLLLGQAVCPADARPPKMNQFVFCGSSTADAATAGYWQVALVKELAERNKEKPKLALVAMDIPISRQGVDNMEQIARDLGIEIVDNMALPPATADMSGAASRIVSGGANYVTSWAPLTTAVQMLSALRRQGWDGWYVHNHSAEAEDTLRRLKDPKFIMSPEYAFSSEGLSVHKDIAAAAKRYGVEVPVDMMALGWAGGMIIEAALQECGWPCTRSSLLEALHRVEVDTGGIFPQPVEWSRDDHTHDASYTAYVWDTKSQSIRRITEFESVKSGRLATVEFVD